MQSTVGWVSWGCWHSEGPNQLVTKEADLYLLGNWQDKTFLFNSKPKILSEIMLSWLFMWYFAYLIYSLLHDSIVQCPLTKQSELLDKCCCLDPRYACFPREHSQCLITENTYFWALIYAMGYLLNICAKIYAWMNAHIWV